MADHHEDFPFEETRNSVGDYFARISDAVAAGYDEDQIWSVIVSDEAGEDPNTECETWTYGPPHHVVDLMGYVATKERHDHQTYYHEVSVYNLCPECQDRLYDENECLHCGDLKAMNEIDEARKKVPGYGRF